jgi:UDP-glucose 4-epimerase
LNIAVVGGSGFIGSHIVDALLKQNHRVVDYDIMRPHRPEVPHIYVDILSPSRSRVALAGDHDALYMLAATANVGDVYRSPAEAVQVNVGGTANVLEAVRHYDIQRIILASTVWVYAGATVSQCDEDTPLVPQRIDHVYTATKIAAELLVYSYSKLYGIKYTVLRYGIPYGERARTGTVIAEFVRRAARHEPLQIHGDGTQKRCYLYVADLAAANVMSLSDQAVNKTYNVEGLEEVSVNQIADRIDQLMGPVKVEHVAARQGDYDLKTASTRRIEEELGWRPTTSFDEGLQRYIQWYLREGDVHNAG